MTLRYSNGHTVEAILLSRNENRMRVSIQGLDDAMQLTEINGAWVTEDCEPVQVEPAWKRHSDLPVVKLDDCICSHELAARLLHMLFSGENDPEVSAAIERTACEPTYTQVV